MKKLILLLLSFHFSAAAQDLQIDWGIQIGASFKAVIMKIDVDEFKNVYVVGEYGGEILGDSTSGLVGDQSPNERSFIAKYDENGSVLWAHSFEGTGAVLVHDMKVMSNGNIAMSGDYIGSVDFDLKSTEFLVTSSQLNVWQGFVMVISSTGDFQWCKTFTGNQNVIGSAISSSNSNELYVGFSFRGSVDFDPGVNEFFLNSANNDFNSAVVKFTESGNFIWAKLFESSGYSVAKAIDVDDQGSCYIALMNFTNQLDCDPSINNAIVNFTGAFNGILISLDTDGNYVWHYAPTTANTSEINAIHVNNGQLYFGGYFTNEINYTIAGNGFVKQSLGAENGFLFKSDLNGGINWCKTIESFDNLRPLALKSSEDGSKIYLGGFFNNSLIDPITQQNIEVTGSSHNAFLLSFSSTGSNLESLPFEIDSLTTIYAFGVIDNDDLILSISFYDQITIFNEIPPITSIGLHDSYLFNLKLCPSFNTAITQVGPNLMVEEQSVNYQWFNCSTNSNILNEVNQSYQPMENGNYAVIVEENGCIDTSECIAVFDLGIPEQDVSFTLFPNPFQDVLQCDLSNSDIFLYIKVFDIQGKELKIVNRPTNSQKIDLSQFKNGIYVVECTTLDKRKYSKRIVKN